MKKTIKLLLASLVATTGILAGCGKKKTDPSTSSSTSTSSLTSTSTNEVTSAVTSQTITSNPSTTIPPDSFVEVGEYTITWINGIGSSYQLVDGGVLPGKANGNDKIEFIFKHTFKFLLMTVFRSI